MEKNIYTLRNLQMIRLELQVGLRNATTQGGRWQP